MLAYGSSSPTPGLEPEDGPHGAQSQPGLPTKKQAPDLGLMSRQSDLHLGCLGAQCGPHRAFSRLEQVSSPLRHSVGHPTLQHSFVSP